MTDIDRTFYKESTLTPFKLRDRIKFGLRWQKNNNAPTSRLLLDRHLDNLRNDTACMLALLHGKACSINGFRELVIGITKGLYDRIPVISFKSIPHRFLDKDRARGTMLYYKRFNFWTHGYFNQKLKDYLQIVCDHLVHGVGMEWEACHDATTHSLRKEFVYRIIFNSYSHGQPTVGEQAVANRVRWVKADMLRIYAFCGTKEILLMWRIIDEVERKCRIDNPKSHATRLDSRML